jgi:pantetheine-phosphate adenylyltransferase
VRRFRLAVLGGTFDHLHVGHHALLASAFRVGETVAIGLTTDRFVTKHPKPDPTRIQPFFARRAALTRWIGRNFPGREWRVVPLEDPFGRSVDPEVEALIVSPDTVAGGRAVNQERRRLGRVPIPLIVVPLALADDLEPVSSRRVRAGAIGTNGRRFTSIDVAVSVSDPRDLSAATRAVRRVFPQARVYEVPPAQSEEGSSAADLLVRVTRRRPSGWVAREQSARLRLGPRAIVGSRPRDLERGLVALLRPRQERKLFGTPRS